MSMGKKLNALLLLIIACLFISTIITWVNLKKIDKNVDMALDDRVEKIRLVDDIKYNIAMQGLYTRALFIENTKDNQDLLNQYADSLDEDIKKFSTYSMSSEVEKQFNILEEANAAFNENYPKLQLALNSGDTKKANDILINELKVSNLKILETTVNILDYQQKALDEIKADTNSSIVSSKSISVTLIIIGTILSIIVIIYIRRGIIKPLKLVMDNANEIAKNNLTVPNIYVKSKDEIGQLANIFNNMKEVLHTLISGIQESANHLQNSSEELTASTEELSASTEEISGQVQLAAETSVNSANSSNESAKAMDETAKGVHTIAEAALQLKDLSEEATATATNGHTIIADAKNQMDIISDSTVQVNELVLKLSKQTAEIESISKVISEITDQTNLLALNASIEAARAGEHGKGFAVVADEVKKLANESKQSANSINDLTIEIQSETKNVQLAVTNAITSVQDGVSIITQAGQSFENIVKDVNTMSEQITDVSSTVEQISASAEEVTASVSEIATGALSSSDGLTSIAAAIEQQAATMNDVNTIALKLNENATSLQDQVKVFKVNE